MASQGNHADVLIIGAGKAGVQTASSLREQSFDGTITVVGDEPLLPYDRPPLSKSYLMGEETEDSIVLHGSAYYDDQRIDLLRGSPAVGIDRAASRVDLADGSWLSYTQLVIATGARPRPAPFDAGMERVAVLRTLVDAAALRKRLVEARAVVVIGGGFIGLEVAAVAATRFDCQVTLVEALPRLMSRSGLPESTAYVLRHLIGLGVHVVLATGVQRVADGEVGAMLADGRRLPADLIVWGTGMIPNDELAEGANLAVRQGVLVDATLRTSDPAVWGVGDCAVVETGVAGEYRRRESLQNATDQARHVARSIVTGTSRPYETTPWFWSDQADLRFQSTGNLESVDRTVIVGDPASGSFTTLAFASGRLLGGDSINAGSDHRALRRLLGDSDASRLERLTPEVASSEGFSLREFLTPVGV